MPDNFLLNFAAIMMGWDDFDSADSIAKPALFNMAIQMERNRILGEMNDTLLGIGEHYIRQ